MLAATSFPLQAALITGGDSGLPGLQGRVGNKTQACRAGGLCRPCRGSDLSPLQKSHNNHPSSLNDKHYCLRHVRERKNQYKSRSGAKRRNKNRTISSNQIGNRIHTTKRCPCSVSCNSSVPFSLSTPWLLSRFIPSAVAPNVHPPPAADSLCLCSDCWFLLTLQTQHCLPTWLRPCRAPTFPSEQQSPPHQSPVRSFVRSEEPRSLAASFACAPGCPPT